MIFSLVYIFGLIINLDLGLTLQTFIVILGSMIIKFLVFNPVFIYAFIILSLFAIILLNRFFPAFISPFFERTTLLISNIVHHLAGAESIAEENTLLFWALLLVLLSFFTAIIIFKKKKNSLLLAIYLSFFLYYWYIYTDAAFWMMALFLFLFFVLMALNKYNLEVFKKDKFLVPDFKDLFPSWIWTGIVYSLIIIVLALSLPKTTNVIKWPWLKSKVYDTFPELEDWRSASTYSRDYGVVSYFDFSSTGYEAIPSRLGGPIELGDEKVMTVSSDKAQYLRGNIKHKYTGDYWEIVSSPLRDYSSGNDFSSLSRDEKDLYYEKSTIKITFDSFSSKTIFSPYRPAQIYLKYNSRLKVDRDYGLMTSNGIYTRESYTLVAQVPLAHNELMKSDIAYSKNDIINLDTYLQIPEERITEATRELTKDIVGDLDTDLEKAMAMEEYLRNNYEYSLDVSIIPEGHEFIDYFLFQEEKGYCTYYATALAIMLRLEGIPTRYIEGYLAHELKEDGIYEVSQKNAHTWVEAFIEPIGWISLEATPAYPISPRLREMEDDTASDKEEDLDSLLPDRDILEEGQRIESQETTLNGNINIQEDKNIIKSEGRGKRYFLAFLGLLILIIPLRILFVFLKLKYRNFKINKLSNRKKIIHLYNDVLELIEVIGYPQKPGETHREYASRISFSFHFFHDKGIKEITEIFIKNKYGDSPVPPNDLLEMEKFKKNLHKRIRNNLGALQYLKIYLKF